MRRFYQRAFDKLSKLDGEQARGLLELLAAENDLLAVVLDSMALGVVVTDTAGQVLLVNRALERMLAASRGGFVERPVWEAIADREIAAFLKDAVDSRETVDGRDFAVTEGGPRILSFGVHPLVRDHRVDGTLIHVDDVSEKRSSDARLRRAESLASLTTLAAGVAHEIKNPLGAIGIHLQLIRKRLEPVGGRLDAAGARTVREEVEVIEEEVDRLNQIVVDYLFAIRPMNVDLASGSINQVMSDLLSFLAPELAETGVEVAAALEEDLPHVLLDERYLREAFLNLISNAIASMHGVPMDRRQLTVRSTSDGETVSVSIGDSGPGIPAEIQGKIFEPYFTTRDFGSGLGLTLVYKIVKEHLGEISVNSREGQGATFTISIPVPARERRLLPYSEAGALARSGAE